MAYRIEVCGANHQGLALRLKFRFQLTPSGSLPSSNKGSNTNLAKLNDELEADEDSSPTRRSKLKFDSDVVVRDVMDDVIDDDDNVNTKRLCTVIKKASMTNDEITQVIECLLKKEEQNNWVGEKNKPSVVSQMKQVRFILELDGKRDFLSISFSLVLCIWLSRSVFESVFVNCCLNMKGN